MIIRLLCDGMGTRDMIEKLHISEDTLKRHLSTIFDKTGMENRTQLVVFALAKGFANIE